MVPALLEAHSRQYLRKHTERIFFQKMEELGGEIARREVAGRAPPRKRGVGAEP